MHPHTLRVQRAVRPDRVCARMTFHSGVHIEECLGQMDEISGSSCRGSAASRSAFVTGEWDWRDEKVRSPS